MRASQFPYVATDGWPIIGGSVAFVVLTAVFIESYGLAVLILAIAVFLFFVLVFRDPDRDIPSIPLAIVSPVDGTVVDINPTDRAFLHGEAMRIRIRTNLLGAYTARSPTEGKVLNPRDQLSGESRLMSEGGLWVRTHEDDDVVLTFKGPRYARPVAFVRYGERIGQGQRCAFLRLATHAEIYLPIHTRIDIALGDRVLAGSDIIATLVHN